MTARLAQSHKELYQLLDPRKLRARRALRLNKLYRGFEFLTLRH
jgi:hypothetical protein